MTRPANNFWRRLDFGLYAVRRSPFAERKPIEVGVHISSRRQCFNIMPNKFITNLTGEITSKPWPSVLGFTTDISGNYQFSHGLKIMAGPGGVAVQKGEKCAIVPISEIVDLAKRLHPRLVTKPKNRPRLFSKGVKD